MQNKDGPILVVVHTRNTHKEFKANVCSGLRESQKCYITSQMKYFIKNLSSHLREEVENVLNENQSFHL